MKPVRLFSSIEKLCEDFRNITWRHLEVLPGSPKEKTQLWPGDPSEDVMICAAKGSDAREHFHRQDFFFFNFAYKGCYDAISWHSDNRITIHEGECYIGQPDNGYAIQGDNDNQMIIGVLIQKSAFFKTFLNALSSNATLFRFFLDPQTQKFSDAFIHLKFPSASPVRQLLEMMIIEYANKQPDTQDVLKPMTLTLLMLVARQYALDHQNPEEKKLSDRLVEYIASHPDSATLKEISEHFSYNPNYISSLLRKETGKSFSEHLLEQRMERAIRLLEGTDLSVEEIAGMLGYSNSSNFYKAFKSYYGIPPREYAARHQAA